MFNPMWFVILLGSGSRPESLPMTVASRPMSEETKKACREFINTNLFKL